MNNTFTPNNFWHMQMHPTGEMYDFAKHIPYILEHHGFIGLGEWDGGAEQIDMFKNDIKVNDIIAIRQGATFVALVQVIGGAYFINDDNDERTEWIKNRRPVRVLDWEIDGTDVRECPQRPGTLNRCASDDAETTKVIKDWYAKVAENRKARGLPLSV
ncbi:hypothetical protein LU293_05295 [Moraxella nasovis]|uniref:hypothetical protein n=1 Tax=Moraxella nasovis TaxID=2904121 RepID=UPI001F6066B7|nr:hypothetical protein [Moraxella nasovis]UNU72540.1 hypothetical protein LU293_05295 [Moraxella nasovis]